MKSIRHKLTLLNVIAITVAVSVPTVIGTVAFAGQGHSNAEQSLALLCKSGENNLNSYFESVEQSIKTVSSLVNSGLVSISDADFPAALHDQVERARTLFYSCAVNTNGALTYYYRLDPSITTEKGFWYTNLDGKGFVEHEVTDLTDDQFECRWFYEPKNSGKPLWLPPYVTDNLDIYVVSYNVPVYRKKTFVGVVGIEIDYKTIGEQIKDIKVLNSGYAFIVENQNGTIICHPEIDILAMPETERPPVPQEFLDAFRKGNHHVEYTFQGVEKHAYWLSLRNGMTVVVAVPLAEVNQTWQTVVWQIGAIGAALVLLFILITALTSRHITKPLKDLTAAAEEINGGNYDVHLDYKGNDEIGVLTTTFNHLIEDLGTYINDLSSLAYADALTKVRNKSAFNIVIDELQSRIDRGEEDLRFGIAIFDCDGLKDINDAYGHDKGDVYLRNSSNLMSRVFANSIVYRIGGDEFAAILIGEDYKNRKELQSSFMKRCEEVCAFTKKPWERIRVSMGIASYDPKVDKSADDVVIHADHLMYINKRDRKKARKK